MPTAKTYPYDGIATVSMIEDLPGLTDKVVVRYKDDDTPVYSYGASLLMVGQSFSYAAVFDALQDIMEDEDIEWYVAKKKTPVRGKPPLKYTAEVVYGDGVDEFSTGGGRAHPAEALLEAFSKARKEVLK